MEVDKVRALYASLPGRLDRVRRVFGRPLPLTETIVVVSVQDAKRCTPCQTQANPGKDNR